MRWKCYPNFVPACLIFLSFALLIPACATKLVDVDRSVPKLGLSQEQSEVVVPRVEAIRNIAEEYAAKKEEFEQELEEMRSEGGMGGGGGMREGGRMRGGEMGEEGGRPGGGFRDRFTDFRKQREAYLSAIDTHVAEIKAVLNDEQLAAFSKMKMPELEMPEMPGRGGPGGRGPGGGRGGGPGGPGGMGGGGMF